MSRSTSPSSVGRSSPASSVSPPASSVAPPRDGLLDPVEDAVAVALVDHRADLRAGVERVAGDERLDLRPQPGDEVVVGGVLHVHALHRDAALAGERVAVGRDGGAPPSRGRRRRARSRGVELPSSSDTFLRDARSRSFQPTADEPVKVISLTRSSSTITSPISLELADDDVQPPGRLAGVLERLRSRSAESGVDAGRLEHDRAARGERRRDLVRDQVEREVERRDRADDPDRQPHHEAGVAGARRDAHPCRSPRRRASGPRRPRRGRSARPGRPRPGRSRSACPPRGRWSRRTRRGGRARWPPGGRGRRPARARARAFRIAFAAASIARRASSAPP